ncbi:MAG: ABC transporter substrate-binding protein [Clostridiales bacterium]|nr:ABC transporter substrate-binding protein [Clostridiales bacterium]
MNRFKKGAGIVTLLLVFILLFAACGGGSQGNGASPGGSAPAGGNGTGGKPFVVGVSGTISSLDMNQEAGILNYYISSISMEGLVGIDNSGKVIPVLAESWKDDNATVWTFKLRQGVKFWNGETMTADDVVWSIQRAMDAKRSPGVAIYFPSYVKSVAKTADDEVTITLDGPHASFIWAVSNTGGLFVTPKAWGEDTEKNGTIGSPKDLIVGTGPYIPKEFSPGSHVTYVANPNWWNGKPNMSSIRFDFFQDENTRLLAFTQGDMNFALNIPVDQSEQWAKVKGAQVNFIDDRSYFGLTFDPNVAPFNDEHVRKAVAYAIDKDSIVSGSILKGHGTAATAISAPEQFAVVMSKEEATSKLASVTHYDFDMAKAKAELAASGSAGGFETTITYPDAYPAAGQASLALADSLKQIGITLDVKEIPLDQWLNEIGNGKQGVGWMIYFPTTPEPGEIAMWLLDARGAGYNPANWTNDQVAQLTQQIMSAPTFNDQIAPIIQGNSIAQEQVIYAPVWWGQAAIAYQQGIQLKDYNSYSLLSSNWPQLFTS